jgi:hypothetical protein
LTGLAFQLKSGRTSAPRLPQVVQVKRSSMSDSLRSSVRPLVSADCGRVAAAVVRAIDQNAAHAHVAHIGEGGSKFTVLSHTDHKPRFCFLEDMCQVNRVTQIHHLVLAAGLDEVHRDKTFVQCFILHLDDASQFRRIAGTLQNVRAQDRPSDAPPGGGFITSLR